eukprot:SAG31_NODE_44569_length_262_cov_0.638037_1_plen_31_part_10
MLSLSPLGRTCGRFAKSTTKNPRSAALIMQP